MKKNLIILLSFLSLTIFAAESAIKPGTIILLNGTSSAGKSSIVKELENIYKNNFQAVSIDGFIHELSIDWDKDEINWDELWAKFYTHVKNLSETGQIIVIDTVCYEAEYEKYNAILGSQLIKILVYCPLDIIIEHIEKRNNSGDALEHRSLCQACEQFLSLYSMQNSSEDIIIDRVDSARILYVLDKLKEEIDRWSQERKDDDETDYQKLYDEGYQAFDQKFHLHELDQINITQIYPWNFIVNTGINSSTVVAQKVIEFINTHTIAASLNI